MLQAVTGLLPDLQSANTFYFTHFELFAVLILCDDSAFCDEMGDYFATRSRRNDRHCM